MSHQRAITLLFNNKINSLQDSDLFLSSINQKIYIPKVAILKYFVKAPYIRRVALTKENVFIRDNYTCQYCGENAESIDHVTPKSKGGSHEWSNVVACCKKCNLIKADKFIKQTNLKLKKLPFPPKGNFWIKTIIGNNPDPSWEVYLETA